MTDIRRTYKIEFSCRPTVKELIDQLTTASKVIHEYTRVEVRTNGSSDPDLEEVTLVMIRD